jgi:hypothetical protein
MSPFFENSRIERRRRLMGETALGKLMQYQDPAKSKRVMEAMLIKMDKLDIALLEQACAGTAS